MKAIVYTKYGPPDFLQLKEVEKPTAKDNEVLIRIHAATVTAGDCEIRSFKIPIWIWLPLRIVMGIRKPRRPILGAELAGEIETVGSAVKLFKKGDQVFGSSGLRMGAYAEYKCQPAISGLAIKPANLSYEQAATISTGGLNSLHFLRKANIQKGEKVLINGAGGSIGTYGVQLAKLYGAEVTAVDSARKLDMLRAIGADHVIDYRKEDFTKNGESYDVIFEVAAKSSFSRGIRSLNPNGRYLLANPRVNTMLRGLWVSMTSSKNVIIELAGEPVEDLIYIAELMEAGTIKSVIDKRYPLEELAEAHRYVDTGDKAGNVVITVKEQL